MNNKVTKTEVRIQPHYPEEEEVMVFQELDGELTGDFPSGIWATFPTLEAAEQYKDYCQGIDITVEIQNK